MKTISLIIFISIALIIMSCQKDIENKPTIQNTLDSVEVIIDTLTPNIRCLDWYYGDSIYIIKDNYNYQKLMDIKANLKLCENFELPTIDFTKYTLLGYKLATNKISFPNFTKTLTRYNYLKKYVYHIEVTIFTINDAGVFSFNWLLVPKIPDDFVVEFDSTRVYVIK